MCGPPSTAFNIVLPICRLFTLCYSFLCSSTFSSLSACLRNTTSRSDGSLRSYSYSCASWISSRSTTSQTSPPSAPQFATGCSCCSSSRRCESYSYLQRLGSIPTASVSLPRSASVWHTRIHTFSLVFFLFFSSASLPLPIDAN
jgi:hypothetical protein